MILSLSYQKMKGKNLSLMFFCLVILMLSSCTYRFTNLHLRPPLGARTIAVESIYDTSQAVVPHELLWESLQKAFATDGRLQLVPSENADVYLRAQLTQATVTPYDIRGETIKDPPQGLFHSPTAYSNLKKASRYVSSESLSIAVHVEVWHLDKKKRLMEKTYRASGNHKIFDEKIPIESRFIKAEESFEVLFASLAERLSKEVVRDFLSLNLAAQP